jgi:hypothetical protein
VLLDASANYSCDPLPVCDAADKCSCFPPTTGVDTCACADKSGEVTDTCSCRVCAN